VTLAAGRKLAAGAGLATAVYGIWVAPRLMRWGATDGEVTGLFPGAGIVPEGQREGTMAVTIEAPPGDVWPWLVQMGWNRGGWYSWDRLDNAGRPSARKIHPEWQDLAVGDHLQGWSPGGLLAPWEVAALQPNRFLGLHKLTDLRGRSLDPRQPRPAAYLEGLWGFWLKQMPGGRTRLVIGGYQAVRPRWVERFVFSWTSIPVVWIMQARTMAVLKRNIERAAGAGRRRVTGKTSGRTVQPGHSQVSQSQRSEPLQASHGRGASHDG
jgi:proline iminopeptidase